MHLIFIIFMKFICGLLEEILQKVKSQNMQILQAQTLSSYAADGFSVTRALVVLFLILMTNRGDPPSPLLRLINTLTQDTAQ